MVWNNGLENGLMVVLSGLESGSEVVLCVSEVIQALFQKVVQKWF